MRYAEKIRIPHSPAARTAAAAGLALAVGLTAPPALAAPTRVRHDAPSLIVAATGDPRTTYRGSVALHDQLPSSGLLTLQGANRHALYGEYGNACVDTEVNRYLATGKLPRKDETCVK